MAEPLLELDRCSIRFGGLTAVSELSARIDEHELVALIGPNGAGKTTVFNLITGVYRPTAGAIRFAGRSIDANYAHAVSAITTELRALGVPIGGLG